METLLVEINSASQARKLKSLLSSMDFVSRVASVNNRKKMISALEQHETIKKGIVKNKNKAFAKYL
jgi:hypothetical protein